jgi:hypothetical protein
VRSKRRYSKIPHRLGMLAHFSKSSVPRLEVIPDVI